MYIESLFYSVGGADYAYPSQPSSNVTSTYMTGQIYVERLDPLHVRHEYPLVFIAGNGQTGTVPLSSHHLKLITRPLTPTRTG